MATPIDTDKLLAIMDNDYQLLVECLDDFLEDCDSMLSSIQTVIDSRNSEMLEKEAHALKGTLRYLAADPAADLAHQLESMAKTSNFHQSHLSQQILVKECERVKNFIVDYKSKIPPSKL